MRTQGREAQTKGNKENTSMPERIFNIPAMVPEKGRTYGERISGAKNHDIHLWRISPGEWIYPHLHPHTDDIWYIVQGTGEYYTTAQEKKTVTAGDIAIASQGDVHGIFNSGSEDIVIFSVLAPLPLEIKEAPDFDYPELPTL